MIGTLGTSSMLTGLGRFEPRIVKPLPEVVGLSMMESAGQWGVTEVAPITMIARVARDRLSGARLKEMKQLVRLGLPADPRAAAARVEQLLNAHDVEQRVLRDILAELPLQGSDPLNGGRGRDHACRSVPFRRFADRDLADFAARV
ncbi:hypothetical protein ACIQVR_29980 [Streptomyces xanthochromogenes]|uniref:hypothetical protein n=1 Tax=Streptomyces xanthochromogenes TaxID=67384 RepID=UPI003829AB74